MPSVLSKIRSCLSFAVAQRRISALHAKLCLAIAMGVWGAAPAQAQSFPSRPLHIVVGATPGGGLDLVARALAADLSKRLGQPVIVDNKPGAATNIGSDFVAKSAPDGYTILLVSPAIAINMSLFKTMPFDVKRDFTPVILAGAVPSVMITNKEFTPKTVAEFTALAKSKPGALNYGAGTGTSEHLAAEMFRSVAGLDYVGVMYKGGAPAMSDLIGGQIQFMFTNLLGALPQIKGSKVKALGVTDSQRSIALPNVPTFAEAGYPAMDVSVWYGLLVPKATPADVVGLLNREARESVKSDAFRTYLETNGGRVIGGSSEDFGKFLDAEVERWRRVVTSAKIPQE